MKTTAKLIQAAIVSVILITAGNVGTQIYVESSAILSKPSQEKTDLPSGCATDSRKFAVTSDAFGKLIDAIATIESGGRTNIMGDQGKAAGCLQIHRCALLDVNRQYGTCYEWPRDALNPHHARNICKLYLNILGYNQKPLEVVIRKYNGGYKHWQNPAAGRYWKKIQKELR